MLTRLQDRAADGTSASCFGQFQEDSRRESKVFRSMGNVISRCAHGISIAMQKCRSQKKRSEEGKLKERKNPQDMCDVMQKWDEGQVDSENGPEASGIPAENCSSACNGIQYRNTKQDGPSQEHFQHSSLSQCKSLKEMSATESIESMKHVINDWNASAALTGGSIEAAAGPRDVNISSGDQTDEEGCVTPQIRALVERQEKVLQDLQALQRTVQTLAEQKGVNLSVLVESLAVPSLNSLVTTAVQPAQSPLQVGKLHEVVVNIDPSSVPLSLLVLLKQLADQYKVLANTYVHSSALDTPENLRRLFQNGVQQGSRSDYQLSLSIIWKKDLDGPQLMVRPTRQTFIRGETNIARYLARLLQPAYDEGDITMVTQIDELLDLAELQVIGGNNKERAGALRTLNSRLGKAQWLVGSQPSLADVMLWSALQSTHLAADAPANVKKWLKACGELTWFQQALQFRSS